MTRGGDVTRSPILATRGLGLDIGGATIVADVSLEVAEGELLVLLGPSGCGKTTTLRMIAGFEDVTDGQLTIDDADMFGIPPHKRPTNTVFQSYALFPHLNVAGNVAFGLKRRRSEAVDKQVADVLDEGRRNGGIETRELPTKEEMGHQHAGEVGCRTTRARRRSSS